MLGKVAQARDFFEFDKLNESAASSANRGVVVMNLSRRCMADGETLYGQVHRVRYATTGVATAQNESPVLTALIARNALQRMYGTTER